MLIEESKQVQFGDGWIAERVMVTPELAKEWLANRARNRTLSEARARKFAGIMDRGEWQLSPYGIMFNKEDQLMDGQTRLRGVVIHGKPVEFIVYLGVDWKLFTVLDQGKSRGLNDVLHILGETQAHKLASAVSLAYRVQNWYGQKSTNTLRPTVDQALYWLEENPNVRNSVKIGERVWNAIGVGGRFHSTMHYEFARIDEEQAPEDTEFFFDKMVTGSDLDDRSPVRAMRNQVLRWEREKKLTHPDDSLVCALYVKAWNAFRDGKDMTPAALKWRRGGANPEKFPIPR